MPDWVEWIVGASVLVVAVGVIWTKVLRPAAKIITLGEQVVPLLRDLTAQAPNTLKVLDDMAQQFRTDSGSSLRDVVNRLETAANEAAVVATQLAVGMESARRLSETRDAQLERAVQMINRLDSKADLAAGVAQQVADELGAAQGRADAVEGGQPGEAADAGLRSDPNT